MITILTPTYNRAYTLTRLYDSLISQTNQNFEWLIIDDGSSDDTLVMVKSFQAEKKINIHYFYQENKGKPQAINSGVQNSKGNYIFIVDSDDLITDDAIKTLNDAFLLHEDECIDFSGICFRKGNLDGSPIGDDFDGNFDHYSFCNATDLKNNFNNIDLAYCFKVEYIKKYSFPSFNGEKFIPELYIWNKITDLAGVYFYKNKVIYLCEYLPDGLTANFKDQLKKNPNGFAIYYKDQFLREKKMMNKVKMLIRILQCYLYKARN